MRKFYFLDNSASQGSRAQKMGIYFYFKCNVFWMILFGCVRQWRGGAVVSWSNTEASRLEKQRQQTKKESVDQYIGRKTQ